MITLLLLLSAPTPRLKSWPSRVLRKPSWPSVAGSTPPPPPPSNKRPVPCLTPPPWLNAAEAWEKAGAIDRAAEDCEQALAVPEASAVHRQAAFACLDRHGPQLAFLEVQGPSTGTARIDDRSSDLPTRRWLRPGRYVLRLEDRTSGTQEEEVLNLVAGQRLTRALTPPPPPPALPRVLTQTPTSSPALVAESPGPGIATWAAFGVAGGRDPRHRHLGRLDDLGPEQLRGGPQPRRRRYILWATHWDQRGVGGGDRGAAGGGAALLGPRVVGSGP
jgi:hypothetical protein